MVNPRRPFDPPPAGLVMMRRIATLMLVAMAATFLVARRYEPANPWVGFVRAFAEAAMVGGLADWFAVTALFRHPLGLPIPHTAIVPRNKDRIGDQLALFLRSNFLIPHVVARRMRRIDVAGAAGAWLAAPTGGGTEGRARLTRGVSRLAVEVLQALDQERLGGMVRGMLVQQVRTIEASPLAGRALGAAVADGRHLPVMDAALKWARDALSANDGVIRDIVHDRAWKIVRWTGLDDRVADKLIQAMEKLLDDVAEQPDHPLRRRAEEGLANLAWDLQYDDAVRERVENAKIALLENPAMQDWINGLWERARTGMLGLARDPERLLAGRMGEMLKQLGGTLQDDPRLRATINRFIRRAAVGAAADYGDAIVRLVSETVHSWDAETITRRLENAVGQDLQYIRINGTLVGGAVGVAIHAVTVTL